MTTTEFSDAFDTLLSSYKYKSEFGEQSSIGDIVLDEYEKSIFLTQAQDNIVKKYFTRTLSPTGEGFDDSTRKQLDFSSLIKVKSFTQKSTTTTDKLHSNSIIIDISSITPLFIINEKATTTTGSFVVVPINYKNYDRIMSKPYSQPLKKQAWRLFLDKGTSDTAKLSVELILRNDAGTFNSYTIRYIERPAPIILTALPDNLKIDNKNTISQCTLHPSMHYDILEEAVRLALLSRGIETNEMKALRERSKNNK